MSADTQHPATGVWVDAMLARIVEQRRGRIGIRFVDNRYLVTVTIGETAFTEHSGSVKMAMFVLGKRITQWEAQQ